MTEHLILGAAGHIDHGKTALVRALTGVDTDRLPEEKRRGISIDLGFASMELGPYHLGLVDAPGHQRFIRNMLAGATGLDLVMLVVAANDSVKQQTREHLDILRLLDLRHGVVVLTKCDLVDAEWLELVEAEVRTAVSGSFLQQAPLVHASAVTGQGLDQLRDALLDQAARAANDHRRLQRQQGPFRMAVDRAFAREGFGSVVTGSVASGSVAVDDTLELLPRRTEVRVRGLHHHDRPATSVQCGQRAAINLAGVRLEEVRRGYELAALGHLTPSRRLTAWLEVLPTVSQTIKHRSLVTLHAGADAIRAQVQLLDVPAGRLQSGESGWAQLFLSRPAACIWGQPFVLRSESPATTIGGGRIIDSNAERLRTLTAGQRRMLEAWSGDSPSDRVEASLYFAGLRGWDVQCLPRAAGLAADPDHLTKLRDDQVLREICLSHSRTLCVHQAALRQLVRRVEAVLASYLLAHPLSSEMERRMLEQKLDYLPPTVLAAVLAECEKQGRVRRSAEGWALADSGPRLTANERKLQDWLLQRLAASGVSAPMAKELQQQATHHQQVVPRLLELAVLAGAAVRIADGYYLHASVEQQARQRLQQAFDLQGDLTVSQIREILETTRRFAVPFCEYLDARGFTLRDGDRRRWNPSSPRSSSNESSSEAS